MTLIEQVQAREILDSRGHPTIEAEVSGTGAAMGRATGSSGASIGEHEAQELRDRHGSRTRPSMESIAPYRLPSISVRACAALIVVPLIALGVQPDPASASALGDIEYWEMVQSMLGQRALPGSLGGLVRHFYEQELGHTSGHGDVAREAQWRKAFIDVTCGGIVAACVSEAFSERPDYRPLLTTASFCVGVAWRPIVQLIREFGIHIAKIILRLDRLTVGSSPRTSSQDHEPRSAIDPDATSDSEAVPRNPNHDSER